MNHLHGSMSSCKSVEKPWGVVPLGTEVKFLSGGTPCKNEKKFWGGEIPWVSSSEMTQQRIQDTELHVTSEGADNGTKRVPPKTVLAVVRGMSLAKEFRVAITKREVTFNQDLKALQPSKRLDAEYLFYYLLSQNAPIRDSASEAAHGTKKLEMQVLEQWPLPLPPLSTQKKIAAILSSYDDLIENNKRRIALLEKMAEEIYCEWFVRFRFPGHEQVKMVKGVPEGWKVEKVSAIVARKGFGRIYRETELLLEGEVVVIDQSQKEWLGFYNGKPEHEASIENPLLLFGDHSCKMQLMIEPFSLAENVIPFSSKDNMPILFLFYLINSLIETTEYKRHWTELINKQVLVPSSDLQSKFNDQVRELIAMKSKLKIANFIIGKTRDLLLPRLISGKLSVDNLDILFPPSMEETAHET